MGGRKAITPALKSRCSKVKLSALSLDELEEIVQRTVNAKEPLSSWLATRFHQLFTRLESLGSAMQVTLEDLIKTAKMLLLKEQQNDWQGIFEDQLSLSWMAADGFLPKMEDYRGKIKKETTDEQYRLMLQKAANAVKGLLTPVRLVFGDQSSSDGLLTLTDKESTVQHVTAMVRQMISNENRLNSSSADDLCRFGDILQRNIYHVTRYFPEKPYDDEHYRLQFKRISLDTDGILREQTIGHGRLIDEQFINTKNLSQKLRKDELPGRIQLMLSRQWQPLPSLTPRDELREISILSGSDKVHGVELARSKTTGQLWIRKQHCQGLQVTVDFIIAPQQDYFTQISPTEAVIIRKPSIKAPIDQLLNESVFSPQTKCFAYRELQDINSVTNIHTRLDNLMKWLDTFSAHKNISGKNVTLLLKLLSEKQGVCRHKAMIFQILCDYWGIPARQVQNTAHRFVEISADDGKNWRQYQLGGGGDFRSVFVDSDWSQYQLSEDANWISPIEPWASQPMANDYDYWEHNKSIKEQPRRVYGFLKQGNKVLLEFVFEPSQDDHSTREKRLWVVKQVIHSGIASGNIDFCNECVNLFDLDFLKNIKNDRELIVLLSHVCTFLDAHSKVCDPLNMVKVKINYILKKIYSNYKSEMKFLHSEQRVIKHLFDLCELTPSLHWWFIRFFSNHPEYRAAVASSEQRKIEKITRDFVYPEICCQEDIWVNKLTKTNNMISNLQKSKYLGEIVSTIKIDRKLTEIPNTNSKLVPENLVLGLPAFITHSTKVEKKPLIIDCCCLMTECFLVLNETFYFERVYENEKMKLLYAKWFCVCEGSSIISETVQKKIRETFVIWLASHKADSDHVWWWFSSIVNTFYKHSNPSTVAYTGAELDNIHVNEACWYPMIFPKETLQNEVKEPDAVVLQTKELKLLFNEFLDALEVLSDQIFA